MTIQPSVSLRSASERDVSVLVDIARRAWLSAFAQTVPFPMIQAWIAMDREPAWYASYWAMMTVAEFDGKIVGLVQPKDAEVNGLWVHPSAQGRGLGACLLAEAERQIASAGHHTSWLKCSAFNPRAQSFYSRYGYRVTRRVVEPFAGIDEEMLVFEKAVSFR
jgi:ribosomal protein S18 acetylase RimI-like enzyme